MWRKEEPKTQAVPEKSTAVGQTPNVASASRETPAVSPAPPVSPRAVACISQGIKIRGELIANEDLFLDGEVDGKLDFGGASLTIGPNGRIKADITAREIIIRGRVEGKVVGRERVQLWSTSHVIGEIIAERLAIEDGAVLRGRAEAGRRSERHEDAFKAASKQQEPKKPDPFTVPAGPAAD